MAPPPGNYSLRDVRPLGAESIASSGQEVQATRGAWCRRGLADVLAACQVARLASESEAAVAEAIPIGSRTDSSSWRTRFVVLHIWNRCTRRRKPSSKFLWLPLPGLFTWAFLPMDSRFQDRSTLPGLGAAAPSPSLQRTNKQIWKLLNLMQLFELSEVLSHFLFFCEGHYC